MLGDKTELSPLGEKASPWPTGHKCLKAVLKDKEDVYLNKSLMSDLIGTPDICKQYTGH